jgi:hypothetical protein
MKSRKKFDTGMIFLMIFLVSTLVLLTGNYFGFIPQYNKMLFVSIWLIEFLALTLYVCLFHTVKQYVSKR